MKITSTIIFWFFYSSLAANPVENYAVANIPPLLLKNAHVVKRMEEVRYEITEGNRARFYRKVAYTILDEQGDRWGGFLEGIDKLRSIDVFEGSLFDANGKKL